MADIVHGATASSGHTAVPAHTAVAAHTVAHEQPQDWGWHHEWRRSAPVIGWLFTISLLLLVFGNHTGHVEDLWILGIAVFMAVLLVRDRIRRKNAWRA